MARKSRIEVEGGLYHLITRGNDRKDIFQSREDHDRFIHLLMTQKQRLPFYFYAYCLMTNHIHLLIERRTDDIGRIMHDGLHITIAAANRSVTCFRGVTNQCFANPKPI